MPSSGKAIAGRALLASTLLTAVVVALIWLGWLPVDVSVRPIVTLVLLTVAVIDGLLGLRFLGEP